MLFPLIQFPCAICYSYCWIVVVMCNLLFLLREFSNPISKPRSSTTVYIVLLLLFLIRNVVINEFMLLYDYISYLA